MAKKAKKKDAVPAPAVYQLPPGIEDLFDWGGRLADLRVLATDGAEPEPGAWVGFVNDYENNGGDLGHPLYWWEALWFEHMGEQDEDLKTVLAQLPRRKYSAAAIDDVKTQLAIVFETKYLVELIKHFDQHLDLIAKYFAARHAHENKRKT